MAYQETKWIDGVTPLNAKNMNNIEKGIKSNSENLASKIDFNDGNEFLGLVPSNNYVDLELTGEITSMAYTAPENGFMYFVAKATGNTTIIVNTGRFNMVNSVNANQYISIVVPVAKNSYILYRKLNSVKLNEVSYQFIYAKKVGV